MRQHVKFCVLEVPLIKMHKPSLSGAMKSSHFPINDAFFLINYSSCDQHPADLIEDGIAFVTFDIPLFLSKEREK